jgi:uncharacterized protein YkwD
LAVALLLSVSLSGATSAPAEASCPTPSDLELEVVDRINAERTSRGVAAVEYDARLFAAALRHSEDMRDGCFLSHTGSDGSTRTSRMLDAGYPDPGREAAGAGQTSAAQIVNAWMNSSAHRAILLDARHRHVGVGYAVGSGLCLLQPFNATVAPHFWTADFGESEEPAQQTCEPLVPECSDGVDNDGNGFTDTEDVLRCDSPDDPVEQLPCEDGVDNDGDGLVDHPDDPECMAPHQISESDPRCGLGFELVLILGPLVALRRRRGRPGR